MTRQTEKRPAILLVDDKSANLLALQEILSDMKLDLVTASSGKEALRHILQREFAAVILDVKMPEMDGFETAELIRAREKTKHLPIIFVTAMYTDSVNAARGYSLGAVDYIVKPYVAEVLKSKVAVFVELFKKTEEIRMQSVIMLELEKREHEARLVEQKQRLEAQANRVRDEHRITQSILEHAPIGIARVDSELTTLEVNEEFGRIFRKDKNLLLRRDLIKAVPSLDQQEILRAIKARNRFFEQALPVKLDQANHADAKDRYFDLAIWPIEDPEGNISGGAVIVAVDVTERVHLAEQRDDFVATLAHDLQTPVIASDRALEVFEQTAFNVLAPEQQKLIGMLRANNRTLLEMIQGLLEIYRYEAGVQSLYFDSIGLSVIAATCVEELLPIIENHGLSVEVDVPDDVHVRGDRVAVRRVIVNLLDNAIKFTPRGGEIKIKARKSENAVLIEISDTGIGINEDAMPHLFDRYWHRSHPSQQKGVKKSCGLGLYLSKHIVSAHDGDIHCVSEPGKGTTFYLSLPEAADPEATTSPPKANKKKSRSKSSKAEKLAPAGKEDHHARP